MESPSRSSFVNAGTLHVSGGSFPPTPKKLNGSLHNTPPAVKRPSPPAAKRPSPPAAKRPSPPGFELPKVLQSSNSNLCLRASQHHIHQQPQHQQSQQQQQQSSPTLRPKTSPSRPTYAPPLLVQSLHVIPRPQASHSSSLLKLPLRQRPVTACVGRSRGGDEEGDVSTISCPRTYYSPKPAASPTTCMRRFNGCADSLTYQEGSKESLTCATSTPPKCQEKIDMENDSNSSNKSSIANMS